MADSERLSATPPTSRPNSSCQHTSCTPIIISHDELHRPEPTSCDIWPDSSQAPCEDISKHMSPTSHSTRSPALSHETHEESHDVEGVQHSNGDSIMGARVNWMDVSGGKSQASSSREHSRIRTLPSQSGDSDSKSILKRSQNHQDIISESAVKSPRTSDILKLWRWEVCNSILAIGVLGSMCTILRHYDGRPSPDWGAAINLSTLIALMATLIRTMLVFVASEIIGQAKWDYLASHGPPDKTAHVCRLIKTSRFNDASQGLLGAVKLFPTIIRDPATLTAVMVMIVSLGTGSFVQQAIQTQSCQFPENSVHASLPISQNFTYDRSDRRSGFGPTDIPNINAALASSLAPASEETYSPVAVVCSTGNCTFENPIGGTYCTLGICSTCADTSSLITSTGWKSVNPETNSSDQAAPPVNYFRANYTLPNGMLVEATFSNITSSVQITALSVSAELDQGLNWAGDLVSSEMKALSQWAFANITILTSNWLPTNSGYEDYVAATCTLYPCLRSYKASITSGNIDEVLHGTVPAIPNVADVFRVSPEKTGEDLQQAMQGLLMGPYSPDRYGMLSGTFFQAIQSPCLVNNTIWTKGDGTSSLDMQRVVLIQADPDPNGVLRFSIENTTAPAECIYGMDLMSYLYFRNFMMKTSFNGSCFAYSFRNDIQGTMTVDCGNAYWLATLYSDEGATAATIIDRIESFTDRLSNKMRMGLLNRPRTVFGQVLHMTVCSTIQYRWLAFPAVLVVATNGLLAWSMFQSSRRLGRVMVWKTSILPFLFYSERFVVHNAEDVSAGSKESSQRDKNVREPLLDLDQMEAEARQRQVRFEAFS